MMKRPLLAMFACALFAAAVVAALVMTSRPRPVEAPPAPASPPAARLMPPEDADHVLYIDAARGFLLTHPKAVTPLVDPTEIAATGYIPACGPEKAVACFPYGREKYAGTNFETAALAVHVYPDAKDEAACLAARPDEVADGTRAIGGVAFSAYAFSDAAMSHRLDGRNYRAFRNGACYELSTRVGTTVFEVYEPGLVRRYTDADLAETRTALDAMLESFRFQEGLERL